MRVGREGEDEGSGKLIALIQVNLNKKEAKIISLKSGSFFIIHF